MKFTTLWIAFVLAVMLLASATFADKPINVPPPEKFHLFLLVGQSNMAGRGKIETQDTASHARVLMLSKTGAWVPAVEPMHFDKSSAGVGLGRTFGMQLADANPNITIGLIPCAVGGSPIDTWKPGEYYTATKSHPWDDAIKRAKLAQQSGEIKGILWHQGESDATSTLAPVYEAKLHALIQAMREELKVPDAPFIAGQIGQFADSPWSDAHKLVNAAHEALSQKIPHTAFVSSDKLQHKGDKVHFNAESYREFGKRYAAAYVKLLEAPMLK
jgi:Carbohydrate esterase, sialic acid-specific acetylesterase